MIEVPAAYQVWLTSRCQILIPTEKLMFLFTLL